MIHLGFLRHKDPKETQVNWKRSLTKQKRDSKQNLYKGSELLNGEPELAYIAYWAVPWKQHYPWCCLVQSKPPPKCIPIQ